MPVVTDLSGRAIGPWLVTEPAPTVNRVRFWAAQHSCGRTAVLAHSLLMKAMPEKGGAAGTLPPCGCEVEGERVSVGMHVRPGEAPHLVGTPCAAPVPTLVPDHHDPRIAYQGAAARRSSVPGLAAAVDGSPYLGAVEFMTAQTWNVTGLPDPDDDGQPVLVKVPASLLDDMAADIEARYCQPRAEMIVPLDQWPPDPDLGPAEVPWQPVTVYGKAEALEGAQDALDVFRRACSWEARAASGRVGMSNLGTPCDRKLGYRLALGTPAGGGAWRAFVGTAVHLAADDAYSHDPTPGPGRWLTRIKLTEPAWGEVDAFDRLKGQVIDWKFPGITAVRRYYKGDVGGQYDVQLDLYGLGMALLGYEVNSVALLAIPTAGELSDAAWYERPWNPNRAHAALERRDRLAEESSAARELEGTAEGWVAGLPKSADNCQYCPVLKSGLCDGVGQELPPPPFTFTGAPTINVPPPPGVGA